MQEQSTARRLAFLLRRTCQATKSKLKVYLFFLNNIHGITKQTIPEGTIDTYEEHFGVSPKILSDLSRGAVDRSSWHTSQENLGKLAGAFVSVPEGTEPASYKNAKLAVCNLYTVKTCVDLHYHPKIIDKLKAPFQSRQATQPRGTAFYFRCFNSSLLSQAKLNCRTIFYPRCHLTLIFTSRQCLWITRNSSGKRFRCMLSTMLPSKLSRIWTFSYWPLISSPENAGESSRTTNGCPMLPKLLQMRPLPRMSRIKVSLVPQFSFFSHSAPQPVGGLTP